ncbi:TonB-dependent receptor [Sphingobium sp. SCG-1]|uniref:TonB-dependent receptor n=1 Tax=Sphingobium sp. SCG-1 TaxID=2072936 RepID=UPI0016703760|nr:TonB-dependent receptor plug domain-containing protein [Sphingobium sp. SCG-1]
MTTTSDGPADIIVTARKRDETELNVPAAVTVIRQEDLIARGATNLRDISSFVPGLNIGTGVGGNTVIIRGINTGADASATSGVVIDGAPTGSSSSFLQGGSSQFDLDPSDIRQVEVLRGPQGTYYGASTLGGLVSYVTRKPSLTDFGGSAHGEVADTDGGRISYLVSAAADMPLVRDKLAVRVSGFDDLRGGFINDSVTGRNRFNRAERYGGRLDLLFKPTSNLTIDLWGAIQRTDRDGEDFVITDADGKPLAGRSYNQAVVPTRNQDFKFIHGSVNLDLGRVAATYIGSYQDIQTDILSNYSNAPIASLFVTIGRLGLGPVLPAPFNAGIHNDLNLKKNTHELRFSSTGTGPLQFLVGGFYTRETADQIQRGDARTLDGKSIAGLDQLLNIMLDSSYEEYAAFANVSYQVLPKLTVEGGFRIGRDNQHYQQFTTGSAVAGLNAILTSIYGPAAAFVPATPPASSKETVKTYLADAKYQFSSNAQAYLRFATGFRPGGPNVQVANTPATFSPDRVKSYEVGFKAQTSDRRASLDISGFYIDWTNIQVIGSVSGFSYRTNGGKAVSKGVEAVASVRPVSGLQVGAIFAYTDATLSQDIAAVGGISGDPLPLTPKFSSTVTADYDWPISGRLHGVLGGVIRMVSDRNTSFPSSLVNRNIRLDGYATGDLRAGVRTNQFEVTGFVRNVTNELAELSGRTGLGINEVVIQRPRTIGVMASVKY